MPFTAYPFVSETISQSDLDLPLVFILGAAWVLVSVLLWIYIKTNVR